MTTKEHPVKRLWANPQTLLCVIGVIILVVGLGSAHTIYLTAGTAPDNRLLHDFEHSKKYRHELEQFGGAMSIIMDDFSRWFDGLWQGKQLASTVAYISILLSCGCFLVASRWPPP